MTGSAENWPEMRHRGSCACGRCRREKMLVDDLSRASLSAALRHAQNRYEDEYEDEFENEMKTSLKTSLMPGRLAGGARQLFPRSTSNGPRPRV